MVRLLISSAGRRVELINCFRSAAEEIGTEIEVTAVDADPEWSPACQTADIAYPVPRCTDPAYLPVLSDICRHRRINLIIPTIDPELMLYAENRKKFKAQGTDILVSDPEFTAMARDKAETARLLSHNGIPTPDTWRIEDFHKKKTKSSFPLFLKPRDGSCSKGIKVINSESCLKEIGTGSENSVLQKICRGKEYTINAFYDGNGRCAACVPHLRRMVRSGEVCFAETIRIPELRGIAVKLGEVFKGIRGCICFQAFQNDEGGIQVFEINARFGGGYPICDYAGGTFAKWILQELSGQVPDYHDNWEEGLRMLRYDAAVFVKRNGDKNCIM